MVISVANNQERPTSELAWGLNTGSDKQNDSTAAKDVTVSSKEQEP